VSNDKKRKIRLLSKLVKNKLLAIHNNLISYKEEQTTQLEHNTKEEKEESLTND
jgi:hypothetical protein